MQLPQPSSLQIPKVTKGMKPTADEKKSVWVSFPHLKVQYMLPQIQKGRKLVPVFYEDGSIGVDSKDRDPDLARSVDDFMLSITREEAQKREALVGLAAYEAFIKLVKSFLLVNYDFTNDELRGMLTMTQEEFGVMHQIMFKHCLGV